MGLMTTVHRVLALAIVILPLKTFAQTPPLVDIGATAGNGINNAGQVALDSGIYSNGTITPLPTLPGSSTPALPLAINASGQAAGTGSGPNIYRTPILYSNGTLTDLGNACGETSVDGSAATAINATGVVVGWDTCRGGGSTEGFIYQQGTMTLIAAPDHGVPTASFYGINASGQIAGKAGLETGSGHTLLDAIHAVIYQNGGWTDLGLGAGYAINNVGQVTGALTTPSGTDAFIYTGGATVDIGALPGGLNAEGLAINATAQIVGQSDLTGTTDTHAFFYNGVITDLNSVVAASDPRKPFVTLTGATGINDSRLIVVNGTDSRDGKTHAYLLQGPWIDIAPGPLTFPTEAVGAVSLPRAVTVTNAGTTAVPLGTPSTTADFNLTSNCGASLAAAAACTIQVTFAPQASGDRAGSLNFTSNAIPFAVPLSGTAPIAAAISASPTTVTTGMPIKLTWTLSAGTTCTATGGQAGDGWTGTITASGSRSVTETTAGTYTYGLSCAAGSQSAAPMTKVTVNWPPITVNVSASPTTFAAGQSTTLTWSSTNATSCTASGGGANDGWPGNKTPSGSQVVTEAYAPAGPSLTLTFTLSCTSSTSRLSNQASAQAVETAPQSASSKGGGGTFDLLALAALMTLMMCRRFRLRWQSPKGSLRPLAVPAA
jgi:probable HAF family extracellular repeat protein